MDSSLFFLFYLKIHPTNTHCKKMNLEKYIFAHFLYN